MFEFLARFGVICMVCVIACTQILLIFKYMLVRGTLRRMQETSSGDHIRYKNGAAARRSKLNGR